MKRITTDLERLPYNVEVTKVYQKLLKQTKQLLATVERHELRYTLNWEDHTPISFGSKVHELISPLLYLSLQCRDGELLTIYYGFDQTGDEDSDYSLLKSQFMRLVYKLTATENTVINIESCISVDHIITMCSEIYESIEDNSKDHTFVLIKHKPTATKRKQTLAVA
jgi:hypothetical protein